MRRPRGARHGGRPDDSDSDALPVGTSAVRWQARHSPRGLVRISRPSCSSESVRVMRVAPHASHSSQSLTRQSESPARQSAVRPSSRAGLTTGPARGHGRTFGVRRTGGDEAVTCAGDVRVTRIPGRVARAAAAAMGPSTRRQRGAEGTGRRLRPVGSAGGEPVQCRAPRERNVSPHPPLPEGRSGAGRIVVWGMAT